MPFQISNSSDTFFFISWTSLAAFQATSTIIDAWKWWKKFRRPATEYERVINGETVRGWHAAIPCSKFYKNYHLSAREADTQYCPFGLWQYDLDTQNDLMTPRSTSFMFWRRNALPNGKVVHHFRQYSLIQPNASATLLKIVCDPAKWNWHSCRYLTSRDLMISFRWKEQWWLPQYQIYLMDMYRKDYFTLVVQAPDEDLFLSRSLAYLEPNSSGLRLHLFWMKIQDMAINGFGNRLEFIDASYELPSREDYNFVFLMRPSSSESISFPIGNHNRYCSVSRLPMTIFSYNRWDQTQNTDNVFCFTFNHRKEWKKETLTQWLAEFEKSKTGERILNAAQSFLNLSLPSDWNWHRINAMKKFDYIFTIPKSDGVLAGTQCGGILKRWIRPPSLLRSAAEILFKANPDMKMSEVNEATGIDLSDGIPDENKDDCETVIL